MGNRGLKGAVLLLVFAIVFAGCGSGNDPQQQSGDVETPPLTGDATAPKSVESGDLRMLATEPDQGLDPTKAVTSASGQLIGMLHEPLVSYDAEGKPTPALAESWEIEDGGTSYTFTLQPTARFSDGRDVTADDVKFTIDRLRRGDTAQASLASVKSVDVVDPKTVELTLSNPDATLLDTLSNSYFAGILPQAEASDPGYFADPQPSSGAWTLEDYREKDHATLVANEHYWREGFPNIKRITYTFSDDQAAHAPAIESGSTDLAPVGYADSQRFRDGGQVPVYQSDQLAEIFWGFNPKEPPFDDARVRQAVAFQFDREARQKNCWYGTGAVTYGEILRPWDPNYTEITTYKVSREEAKTKAEALLDEAGWVAGDDGMRAADGVEGVEDGTPLAFEVPFEGHWTAASCSTQLLQQNLKEIGIDAKPVKYDDSAFYTDAGEGKFTMYHGGNVAINASDLYLNNFHSKGAYTSIMTHLENPVVEGDGRKLDEIIESAVAAATPEEQKAEFKILEEWQSEYLPMLVVGHQFGQWAANPALKGYYATPHIDFPRALVTAYVE